MKNPNNMSLGNINGITQMHLAMLNNYKIFWHEKFLWVFQIRIAMIFYKQIIIVKELATTNVK